MVTRCSSPSREPLSRAAEGVARTLKPLADPVRLRLLSLVPSHEGRDAWAYCRSSATALSSLATLISGTAR
jgi:ArsR family transcriptional regulator